MTSRHIEVPAMTRVEGEGGLSIRLVGDRVDQVQLRIFEPPRFFEAFLQGRSYCEVPDIVARICGICPVAYQMSACHALEKALGIELPEPLVALRRLLYCGEWIESHALHVFLLHAPDFLGYESGISMARDHREIVERGLRIKKTGNRLLEIVGGRAVHPINVAIGGFHRAPRQADLNALRGELRWCREACIDSLRWASGFDFPEQSIDYHFVSLRHPDEYPMNHGQIVDSGGLCCEVEQYEEHFREVHVAHSTALHSVRIADGGSYLVGPLARYNLCFDQLPPLARKAAEECGVGWPLRNGFRGILVRLVELIAAFDIALTLIEGYESEPAPATVSFSVRAGSGCHATEAPRGLLYHRFAIDDAGLVVAARIVPPTSQNQLRIEEDLRAYLPAIVGQDDAEVARRCEHLVRNYDPCISCSTHFLKVDIDRQPEPETA